MLFEITLNPCRSYRHHQCFRCRNFKREAVHDELSGIVQKCLKAFYDICLLLRVSEEGRQGRGTPFNNWNDTHLHSTTREMDPIEWPVASIMLSWKLASTSFCPSCCSPIQLPAAGIGCVCCLLGACIMWSCRQAWTSQGLRGICVQKEEGCVHSLLFTKILHYPNGLLLQ